jgi:hypothetical protein
VGSCRTKCINGVECPQHIRLDRMNVERHRSSPPRQQDGSSLMRRRAGGGVRPTARLAKSVGGHLAAKKGRAKHIRLFWSIGTHARLLTYELLVAEPRVGDDGDWQLSVSRGQIRGW